MTLPAVVGGLAALALLNGFAARAFTPPTPPLDSIRLAYDDAIQCVGLMSLGMRRLAADLAFIRLLMYYGSAPEAAAGGHEGHHGELQDRSREHPELADRVLRILDLDPFFEYAVQYAAGALAFNLQRPDDALAVLRHAIARDPRNWKYHGYVAAVGFHQRGDAEKVREQLAPIADAPDAPTMLKHMLAFLNVRLGRRGDAIRLYREILRSRDTTYHHMARNNLRALGASEEP
ncbi:MAG: hypothetical protein HY554_01640 [Elusimicrobia bacterium]|nr:hypothetical protein [Elusimicrobiota bacterium]